MGSAKNELYFLLAFYSCKSCNPHTLYVQFVLQFICSRKWYICTGKWQFCIFQRTAVDDKLSFHLCVTLSHCFTKNILLLYKLMLALLFGSFRLLFLLLSFSDKSLTSKYSYEYTLHLKCLKNQYYKNAFLLYFFPCLTWKY